MAALGRVRFSPWLIALLAADWLLAERFPADMLVSLGCVLLHEGGHALCAQLLGCIVERVELDPFGGVVRLSGLEGLRAGQRIAVALAGPAVNLLLALLCGCGAYLLPQWTAVWAKGLECNAALMIFNLLPAFPMDGGRVLSAMMEVRSGIVCAQRRTAALGMMLGVCMAAAGAAAYWVAGKFNLTLLLCGGYVCAQARKERKNAPLNCLTRLTGRKQVMKRRNMLPVRVIAVPSGMADAAVAARLNPGALYRIVYVDDGMHVVREKWETELMDCAEKTD